jgi:hypothetical protein
MEAPGTRSTSISSLPEGTVLATAREPDCVTGTFVQTYWTIVPLVQGAAFRGTQ